MLSLCYRTCLSSLKITHEVIAVLNIVLDLFHFKVLDLFLFQTSVTLNKRFSDYLSSSEGPFKVLGETLNVTSAI